MPRVKQQLESAQESSKLTDKVDKGHKEHTISNMVAHTPERCIWCPDPPGPGSGIRDRGSLAF